MEILKFILFINGIFGSPLHLHQGKLKRTARIINGKLVKMGEHPYMVSLQRRLRTKSGFEYQQICGGALIEPDVVLTAAHCFKIDPKLYASAGITNSRRFTDKRVNVSNYILGDYDMDTVANDIAILKLEKNFTTLGTGGPIINVIQLPEKHYKPKGDCTIAGWGETKRGGGYSEGLVAVDIPITNHSECKEAYKYLIPIRDKVLCAGGGKKDGCQGDSGGPLICYGPNKERFLMGISSWGIGCGTPDAPGVYTDVTKYKDFIGKSIKKLISSGIKSVYTKNKKSRKRRFGKSR